VGKSIVIYVKFLCDFVYYKLLNQPLFHEVMKLLGHFLRHIVLEYFHMYWSCTCCFWWPAYVIVFDWF